MFICKIKVKARLITNTKAMLNKLNRQTEMNKYRDIAYKIIISKCDPLSNIDILKNRHTSLLKIW